MIIFPIDHLPPVIPVGVQTSRGVMEIGFNVSRWLEQWPDMTFRLWVTRPTEAAAYPAEAEMEGSVLVWHVSDVDTAIKGLGKVEVAGESGSDVKILSGPCTCEVRETSTASTQEPPDALEDWYTRLMAAFRAASLPETDAPHQQLVTDSAGKALWVPRLAYEYQAETELLPATALTYGGEAGGYPVHLLMTPLAGEIEQGKVYAVTYNGAEYVCPVVYLPGETADQDGYILGKASVVGLEGGNDDAPFVLLRSVSYEENGYYALCLALDSAESVTISIKGEGTAYKTIDPKYLPDNRVVTAHVNLTKLTTTAIEFGECDMTFAQLWEAFSAGKEVRLLCSYEANGYYQTLCGTVDTSMAVDGSETVLRMTMPKSHFHEGLFYVGIGAGESGEAVFAQITFD